MHRCLSSLPFSDQLCFFVSPRLLVPHQKAETEERLRVGDKSVFAVSCGLGKAVQDGSQTAALWRNPENPARWAFALKASARCFLDALCSAGMIFCH